MEVLTTLGSHLWEGFKVIVYCVDPKDNVFDKVEDVPSYDDRAFPIITFLIFFEQFINLVRGKPLFKVNDAITSSSQGMLLQLTRIWTMGIEAIVYTWIYNNYRLFEVDPYALKTWIFCMVVTDFAYYVIHRAIHEVNILWAIHQVHHSSERYNTTVAIRLQILRPLTEWIAHLPMAIAIPPPLFFVHYELHLLSQVLIHFNVVGSLGFVDYVINTPSNHRVHHGRNRRCIDKNYGGILMIWDHLFGTYENEGDTEVAFGLTTPIKTFNPFYIQFHPFLDIWKRFWAVEGIGNKLSVFFKGPGWSPGKPRLGIYEEIPEDVVDEPYNPVLNFWTFVYVFFHFSVFLSGFFDVIYFHKQMGDIKFSAVCFLFLTSTTNSFLLDKRENAKYWELIRCLLYLIFENFFLPCYGFGASTLAVKYFLRHVFLISMFIWLGVIGGKRPSVQKLLQSAENVM